MQQLTDVRYEVEEGLCWITIDRPERMNSFTAHTIDELIECFKRAWAQPDVGVVALTGAGERAFCTGGDQKQRAASGDYGPSQSDIFEIETLHRSIREIPKPVIAAVNGLAIGGGHVLHVICDLSIAAEHARFGQAGPRVGSFDAGFGTGYLARIVGEKRAREIWFLCRQYDAAEAERWGLVNRVVPAAELMTEAKKLAATLAAKAPIAIRYILEAVHKGLEMPFPQAQIFEATLFGLVASTDDMREGTKAFLEKRKAEFKGR